MYQLKPHAHEQQAKSFLICRLVGRAVRLSRPSGVLIINSFQKHVNDALPMATSHPKEIALRRSRCIIGMDGAPDLD